jgi:hypothetical protein
MSSEFLQIKTDIQKKKPLLHLGNHKKKLTITFFKKVTQDKMNKKL